ncbi:uncharacterized protein LOC141818941, partial [Curcuma longa]|uniref:uncharacterized protein LOC141818941 n=1 Tax=Curcuma longa TaxID=136217 RepID=UPI003D9EFC97
MNNSDCSFARKRNRLTRPLSRGPSGHASATRRPSYPPRVSTSSPVPSPRFKALSPRALPGPVPPICGDMASVLTGVSSSSFSLSSRSPYRHCSPAVRAPLPFSYRCYPRGSQRRTLTVKAAETDANEVEDAAPSSSGVGGSSINQLLGIKGAAQESNKWKIRLQLTKPVTWPPLVWGVVCGAAAS